MSVSAPVRDSGAVDGESGGGGPGARNRALIVIAALTALVVGVATWIVAFSPVLGANTVTVRGSTATLTVAQVRDAAAIKRGTPLIRLDTAAVTRRVTSLPLVASATVRTKYPATVVITVLERVAVGYVMSGQKYALVDKTGDQYATVRVEPRRLPLFVVPAGTDAKATGQAVATVAASLTRALLAKVASVQAFDPTAITLLLVDHRVVRWGSADRSADKARILPVLLTQPGSRFDVSNPDQVVTH